MLNKTQREQFLALFSDLDYELNDMGWLGDETTLINDMLVNHFNISIDDSKQLKMLTESILKEGNLKAAYETVNFLA